MPNKKKIPEKIHKLFKFQVTKDNIRDDKQFIDAQDEIRDRMIQALNDLFEKTRKSAVQAIDPRGQVEKPTITKTIDFKFNLKDDLGETLFEFNSESSSLGVQQAFMDLGITGSFDIYDEKLVKLLRDESITLADELDERIMNDLQTILSRSVEGPTTIPGIAESIVFCNEFFAGLKTWQAKRIAQTEVIGRANQKHHETYKESNLVETRVWMAIPHDGHARPAHEEAHLQEVGIDEPFIVMGEELMYPGDKSGKVKNIVNCRCRVKPGKIKEITNDAIDAIFEKYGG